MKEIIAIIRINKVNQTKTALADIGVCGLNAMKVMGRGMMTVDFSILNELGAREEIGTVIEDGLSKGGRLIPKRMFTIMAPDHRVKEIIDTVIRVNKEGNKGDGKIFVCPVADVVRVRTGEHGDEAL
ncbi:MAG: P-II family nitrogen regulator [Syntrophomonas sp.]